MKKVVLISSLLVLITSFPAYSDSIVRVQCEEEDSGAEIYINGNFVGECPVDAPVKAGKAQLRARKIVRDDYEKVFEKQLRVVDGVAQRVEIMLSAPQLTAAASSKIKTAETTALLADAEAGDIEAMKKLAQRYDAGVGTKKDPAKAEYWRNEAEAATAQKQLRAAEAGNIEAMLDMAARYDTGAGVKKDHSQAALWRNKADAAKLEKAAQEELAKSKEKEISRQRRVDAAAPFKNVSGYFKLLSNPNKGEAFTNAVSSPLFLPVSTIADLTELPTKLTDSAKIQSEAAVRPSTWGKPDSMIARASLQQKTTDAAAGTPQIIAAVK
ncbi:MAG: PEGA domain-containing protein [Geobacteraceae bacterium]|nr:PEGA domain-containing protein [Geobacteraceae bacterium]NTW80065.1 PEGA domain-containing protein [Geobacteraceae bacterium]